MAGYLTTVTIAGDITGGSLVGSLDLVALGTANPQTISSTGPGSIGGIAYDVAALANTIIFDSSGMRFSGAGTNEINFELDDIGGGSVDLSSEAAVGYGLEVDEQTLSTSLWIVGIGDSWSNLLDAARTASTQIQYQRRHPVHGAALLNVATATDFRGWSQFGWDETIARFQDSSDPALPNPADPLHDYAQLGRMPNTIPGAGNMFTAAGGIVKIWASGGTPQNARFKRVHVYTLPPS